MHFILSPRRLRSPKHKDRSTRVGVQGLGFQPHSLQISAKTSSKSLPLWVEESLEWYQGVGANWSTGALPAQSTVFCGWIYWFQTPPQTDIGTSSDMVEVEVRIDIPKETNSPTPFAVRIFVLESGFHNQSQRNILSSAVQFLVPFLVTQTFHFLSRQPERGHSPLQHVPKAWCIVYRLFKKVSLKK